MSTTTPHRAAPNKTVPLFSMAKAALTSKRPGSRREDGEVHRR